MPAKRKNPEAQRYGFRQKIRRVKGPATRIPKPIPGRTYKTRNAMDSEIVALHNLKTYDLSYTADTFDCLQIANVLGCVGLSRYQSRYDRVRFFKLEVE